MQGQASPDQGEKTVVQTQLDGGEVTPTNDPATNARVRVRSGSRPDASGGRRPARWLRAHVWQVVSGVLVALLIAAVAIGAYLWDVSEKWEVRSDQLTALNHELAGELVDEQVAVMTQAQQIALLEDQRSTLQARVLDLADAVSQSGDSAATAEQQITLLTDLVATATSVTNGLNRCIDSKTQLATYRETPEDFEPEELEAFAASVEDLCTLATDANIQYQQQLRP